MSEQRSESARDNKMLAVYRHDAHKVTGQSHADAPDTFAGVPVNQSVPLGADGDAAALSRPLGTPTETVENHTTPYRLSLLTGAPHNESLESVDTAIADLLTVTDAIEMHRQWLETGIAAVFNESIYYPYTSLKYHTLLVAALYDAYRDGYIFADLHLVVDDAATVVPHRTIYTGVDFALRLDTEPEGRPCARIGREPRRSWASTWSRLPVHPLDADDEVSTRALDANLRRITAWSTALQYLEDFTAGVCR